MRKQFVQLLFLNSLKFKIFFYSSIHLYSLLRNIYSENNNHNNIILNFH